MKRTVKRFCGVLLLGLALSAPFGLTALGMMAKGHSFGEAVLVFTISVSIAAVIGALAWVATGLLE